MEYRCFDDTVIVRLDPGEEICERLLEIAEKENIALAQVSAIGAVNSFTMGVFDPVKKEYYANTFQGLFEIVSLTGTITRKDGKPYLHVHMSAGDEKGNVYGGHLNAAVVSATAEILLRKVNGSVGRQMSEKIGLNLFLF